MAGKSDFNLVRGRRMRVTRLDGCGQPLEGPASSVVTEGFISVAFSAQTTEAEAITVTNAGGKTCVDDKGTPAFNGYGLEITFCGVQPCLLEMLTGQPSVVDASGEVVGFKMNTAVDQTAQAFALELWSGVPGVACASGSGGGSFGYILVPFVSSGVVGDFTIENAAVNFVVTGASTKDGNGWGVGPASYMPVPDASGDPSVLPDALDGDDHLYVVWTSVEPPAVTDGCVALPAAPALTGITLAPAAPSLATTTGTQQMTATAVPAGASLGTITWTSGTPGKATVSSGGLVTGVAAGTSVITAASGSITGTATVTVP